MSPPGALPTPLRMRADPNFTGRGVTLAMIDSGFYPHPDLVKPVNRIRAWVDASSAPVRCFRFSPEDRPQWPGWDAGEAAQWHGLMTSAVAAGNGWLSEGLYRGLASSAELVLIRVREGEKRIRDACVARALRWLEKNAAGLKVRVVNISVAGDSLLPDNPIERSVRRLVRAGIAVVAAAGNDGERRLVAPASAPDAITVGGVDDRNNVNPAEVEVWHSNYGQTSRGMLKPELVAPSIWVVAPLLPATPQSAEAVRLFERREQGDPAADEEIASRQLVHFAYKLVEGTSFAAPIVASIACCMIEANPALSPLHVRELLAEAAAPIPGASAERQGAGAVDAGQAVALALRAIAEPAVLRPAPSITEAGVHFLFRRPGARAVSVFGTWNGWQAPGVAASVIRPGVWQASLPLQPGRYSYKFLVDGAEWAADPFNSRKAPDGHGSFNSLVVVPRKRARRILDKDHRD